MSTMSHGPSLYTYVANALCLLCLMVPVSIHMWQMRYVYYVSLSQSLSLLHMWIFTANALCPLCLTAPVSISVSLCGHTYVFILTIKSTMSTISTMPHKSLRGMQRVSNPSTENQRISTPVHSNRWKSERTLVRSQWYKSNKTGYMRSKTHIQEAFCAVYSVYYVYFVYYEVATIGRLLKMIGFCCKRAL